MRAATEVINRSDADLAILFTGTRLRNFYSECGWTAMERTQIMYGEKNNPKPDQTGQIMMLFVSQKGSSLQERLEREPLYVGAVTW